MKVNVQLRFGTIPKAPFYGLDSTINKPIICIFTLHLTANRGGKDLLPVWHSVWPGSLQPHPCPHALPTGPLQEAA